MNIIAEARARNNALWMGMLAFVKEHDTDAYGEIIEWEKVIADDLEDIIKARTSDDMIAATYNLGASRGIQNNNWMIVLRAMIKHDSGKVQELLRQIQKNDSTIREGM